MPVHSYGPAYICSEGVGAHGKFGYELFVTFVLLFKSALEFILQTNLVCWRSVHQAWGSGASLWTLGLLIIFAYATIPHTLRILRIATNWYIHGFLVES